MRGLSGSAGVATSSGFLSVSGVCRAAEEGALLRTGSAAVVGSHSFQAEQGVPEWRMGWLL